jgi:predicted extracellular nuclease
MEELILKTGHLLLLCFLSAVLFFTACGDDETNPAGTGTPPTASTLSASVSGNTVTLNWSPCPNADFSDYTVFRSATAGIAQNPSAATIVAVISQSGTVTASDQGLPWNSDWYYAVRTTDTESLTAWSNETPASIADSSGGGGGGGDLSCYQVQGQSEASPYEGQEVRVTGIVTSGGGELYGGYAVLSDAGGGPWSGLVLFGDQAETLSRGDSISVSGEVSEYYGLTELSYLEDITVHKTGLALPAPEELTTDQVNSEQWEGVVVSVTDAVVEEATQYSYRINDGSGACYLGNRGDYNEPSVGDTLSVTGPLFYEYDQWRIQPRDNQDVSSSGGGGGGGGDALSCYQVQGQAESSPYEGQDVTVTGIVTAGGGELYGGYAVLSDAEGGPWSGLVLFGDQAASLSRGDSISVSGEVDEYYGLTELKYLEDITVHKTGMALPTPENLTTEQVNSEQWEGVVVSVTDALVEEAAEYSYRINDGSGACYMGNRGEYTEPSVGDIVSVTGPLFYEWDEWRIQPRDNDDVSSSDRLVNGMGIFGFSFPNPGTRGM